MINLSNYSLKFTVSLMASFGIASLLYSCSEDEPEPTPADTVSYASSVSPIIETNCSISGCHNGDNAAIPSFTVFENVKSSASAIKTRTASGNMPKPSSGLTLTQAEKGLIANWVDQGALDN